MAAELASTMRIPSRMRRPWFVALLALVAIVLAATGCGEGGDDEGADDAAVSAQPAAVERVELDATSALVWGDGPRGALLAHGAAFDAASWQDQAEQIAASGFHGAGGGGHRPRRTARRRCVPPRRRRCRRCRRSSAAVPVRIRCSRCCPSSPTWPTRSSCCRRIVSSTDSAASRSSSSRARTRRSPTCRPSSPHPLPATENDALIVPGSAHAQNMFASDQADVVTGAILERLDSPS